MDLPPPQIVCIAQVIYAESRGENELGQRAIAHVILNRSKKLHKPPCVIVRQPGQFSIKFQKKYSGKSWKQAWTYANYPGKDPTGGASFFKHIKCKVQWKLKLTTVIGNHAFYK